MGRHTAVEAHQDPTDTEHCVATVSTSASTARQTSRDLLRRPPHPPPNPRSTAFVPPSPNPQSHVRDQAQARHRRRRCLRKDLPPHRLLEGHLPRGEHPFLPARGLLARRVRRTLLGSPRGSFMLHGNSCVVGVFCRFARPRGWDLDLQRRVSAAAGVTLAAPRCSCITVGRRRTATDGPHPSAGLRPYRLRELVRPDTFTCP